MKYLALDDLNSFKCIGSKCKYTCCKGWEISIDSETMDFYHNVSGKFARIIVYKTVKICTSWNYNNKNHLYIST